MSFQPAAEESFDPRVLGAYQESRLGRLLETALPSNTFLQGKLASLAFDASGESIFRLPFTTRDEITQDQARHPPYGTNLTFPREAYTRLHQTSGTTTGVPLRWLDTPQSWAWCLGCWSMVYRGAGVRPDDRIMFAFSFGPFIGFWMAFEAAGQMGLFRLAGGGMSTSARLRYLLENQATVVCCTPTYALHLGQTAAKEGLNLDGSPVRMLIVAGEPGGNLPAVRRRIEESWGARVIDHAGMTELGAWGFECAQRPGGMHIIESEFIAEVINPATLAPVADGQPGELVLTNLGRLGSPLIRYRTGDLVRLTRGLCACGRCFAWLESGILGRLDEMLIIRGNNVFPSAVEEVLRAFPQIEEFRLTPIERGALTDLRIEVEFAVQTSGEDAGIVAQRVAESVRNRLNFSPTVEVVSSGTLPRFEMKARRTVHPRREED